MDPLSASCYSLNSQVSNNTTAQEKTEKKFFEILGSTATISDYETKSFKTLIPQISAAILVTSFHISIGISLAFSAILLPQLEEDKDFDLTKNQASWIASIIALTTPAGSLVVGFLMDHFGRLRTLNMALVPGIAGCITMALSNNFEMLLLGRGLVGFSSALGASPAIVYLIEIARNDMRGSLLAFAPGLTSLGMVLTFIMGWFMHWKLVAWFTNILIAVPCFLVFFVPESPAWLVSKDRIEEARKSLIWLNKYQQNPPDKDVSISDMQLALLQKDHELKMIEASRRNENEMMAQIHGFMEPTGYKPMLILIGLFFCQQFSGFFVFLFYSINFFQEVGATVNPYLLSIFIGIIRFVMSMVNTYIQKIYNRRTLMLSSCVGMSVSIFLSGLFSHWVKNGTIAVTWVPVVFLMTFVASAMTGVLPIPFTMTAELFPLKIRGVAHSFSLCMASVLMFAVLQLHPVLHDVFGGIVGVQYYFGCVTTLAVVYCYVFMPETQGKKLTEIEDYFKSNVVFIGSEKKKEASESVRTPVRRSIVKKQQREHEEHLLEEV